jgi:hypothetical protein
MTEDNSWLEISPPKLPAIVNDESKYQGMVAALKQCSPKQRAYLNALQEACFDEDVARKALADKGTRVSRYTVRKWELEPSFTQALRDAVEYTLAANAVSQVGVVAQLQRAVRVNGALVKCKTEHGVEYEKFVDAAALNTALDRLAKRLGMLKSDEAPASRQLPAFVVGINIQQSPAAPKDVIDVKVTEVPSSE